MICFKREKKTIERVGATLETILHCGGGWLSGLSDSIVIVFLSQLRPKI